MVGEEKGQEHCKVIYPKHHPPWERIPLKQCYGFDSNEFQPFWIYFNHGSAFLIKAICRKQEHWPVKLKTVKFMLSDLLI